MLSQCISHESVGVALLDDYTRRREVTFRTAPEKVASISPEHDHTAPAAIGEQLVPIKAQVWTRGQNGLLNPQEVEANLPATASHDLSRTWPGIEELIVVQHGVLGNVNDYYQKFMRALGGNYDPARMMVVALQFPRIADKVDHTTLRYGYNDWRGGEPALEPSPPIGSFAAKDAALRHITSLLPDLKRVNLRGNSEGGQQDDRYVSFSFALTELEARGIKLQSYVINPGTVLMPDNLRPVVRAPGEPPILDPNEIHYGEWTKVKPDSDANRWPFGMYDAPPDVLRFIQRYGFVRAIANHSIRAVLCVGAEDNDPNASHLPIGDGPDQQGRTRFERVAAKWATQMRLVRELGLGGVAGAGVVEVAASSHDPFKIFEALEAMPGRWRDIRADT